MATNEKKRKIKVRAEDIESEPAFQYFRDKHDLSEKTWIGYINALQRYVEYTGMTLGKLIEEAQKEEQKGIPTEKRHVGKRLIGFRKHLKGLQLSPASIRRMLAAVKSLYINGYSIQVPKLGRDRDLANRIKIENKGIPSREDIIKVLKTADLRERCIILGISSSGLSTTDFVDLQVKDFKEGYDKKTGITTLDMRRTKTQQDFVSFFSVEATEAFNEYLAWRNKEKPKTAHPDILKGWEKHRVYSDEDYLICKKYIPDEYLESRDEELRRENEKGLQSVFRTLAVRAGIARESGMWNMFRAHKLRSWFFSTLINKKCALEHAEIFMGHSSQLGKSTNGTYYGLNIENLKETYLEYMPHLSLLTPVKTKVIITEGYEELKMENVKLKEKIESLEAKEKETKQIWAKIEELDKRYAPILEDPEVQNILLKKRKERMEKEERKKQ